MLPIENRHDMYQYYYQMPFPALPYFFFPPGLYPHPGAPYPHPQHNQLRQQHSAPELQVTAQEASAEPAPECKKEESAELKVILAASAADLPQKPTQAIKPKQGRKERRREGKEGGREWKEGRNEQKEGRNANSNLLRMFFRRLQHRLQVEPGIVQRIARKAHLKIKPGKFLEWLELNGVEHRNYVRLPDMKALFAGKRGSREQAKIMRVLLQDFLQREARLCYLTSRKIKRESMPCNFHSIRNVLADIYSART